LAVTALIADMPARWGPDPVSLPPMTSIYLNGKFTAQRTTGVQRVAEHLIRELDNNLGSPSVAWILLCPIGAKVPALRRIQVRYVGIPGLPLHLWEQLILPLAALRGLLVNLAGAAPFFAREQVCMLHDAAVFDQPQAYTRGFGLWYRFLFRHLARSARSLLTVSTFSRQRLIVRLGVASSRVGVIPNGGDHLDAVTPDDTVIAEHGLSGKAFLLAVGSANRNKNLGALVEAYRRLDSDPTRRLVIAGGSDKGVFAHSVVGDPDDVIRVGPVNDAQLKSLYRHAVALVFPSLYEGFGLPPLESMACGCPVAAARAAAIPEICGDAALYFDPHSIDAITDAMRRLLADAPLRERLRVAGRARAATSRWADSAEALRAELRRQARGAMR